ncbi:hypothetical protein H0H87_004853, partial [Tephrocybe sp. NHM501043]
KHHIHKVKERYQMMHQEKLHNLTQPLIAKYHRTFGSMSLDMLESHIAEGDLMDLEEQEQDSNEIKRTEEEEIDEGNSSKEREKEADQNHQHFRSWMFRTRKKVVAKA